MSQRYAIIAATLMGIALAATPSMAASTTPSAAQLTTQVVVPSVAGKPSTSATSSASTLSVGARQPQGGIQVMSRLPLPYGSRFTLKDAVAIALKYHPRAAEAAAASAAAGERIGEARAYLGPQVYGVGEYLRGTDNGIGNTSYYNLNGVLPRLTGSNHDLPSGDNAQSWATSNNYAGGVAVSQYLLDFGRRLGFVAQRRFEAAATRAQQQLVELQLTFEVSQRYFNLLQARQLVRVYQKAVEQRRYHLHEARVKARAGLRPQLDVYLTAAEVQRAELHLVDARNAEDDSLVAFDNALGLGGMSPHYQLVDVSTHYAINARIDSLLREALHRRPELEGLEDEARAMGAQVREDRSDYLPTVNAVAGYAAMGTGLPAANNFHAGIVISWPIFNSFLTSHQIAETRFRQRAIQSQIEDLRQRIILQVKTALLDWQASLQRIIRAQRTLAASTAELELAERRYQAGLSDIVELEDAQRNYTQDDAAYTNALYGFSVAKAALDEATGRALMES